jgi:transketolase
MPTQITIKYSKIMRQKLLWMHFETNIGHIGGNLSSIDIMLLLWHEFIGKYDQFFLSKGHSAGALYIALWSKNILSDNSLKTFHGDDTLLPGHPPPNIYKEIPFATGSLGHGLSLAAGSALAKKLKGTNEQIYCLTSDGEWQEGSTWEALIFLAHHKLKNLTIFIDQNSLQGFGNVDDISSMDNLEAKLKGFDIKIITCNGHDFEEMRKAITVRTEIPKIIILKTIKGKGVSFMENDFKWHYLPMSEGQYKKAIKELS